MANKKTLRELVEKYGAEWLVYEDNSAWCGESMPLIDDCGTNNLDKYGDVMLYMVEPYRTDGDIMVGYQSHWIEDETVGPNYRYRILF